MPNYRKTPAYLALITALALVAGACAGGGGGQNVETIEGGTVIFMADQEPAILNNLLEEGNLFATAVIGSVLTSPLWRVTPDFQYVPYLLQSEPEVTDDPFTVTYRLRDEAVWSDGTPITSDDIQFTLDTILNEDWTITSRTGYDQVTDTEIVDDKTITLTFKKPYAPWRTMFSTHDGAILPKHVLEGEDFNKVWNDEITLSSGPFVFDSWQKGQQIRVVRNDNFWGGDVSLEEIVFRFIEDSTAQVQQLRGREVDMFYPQPQLDLVEQVAAIEGVTSEASAGPIWEHIDFNEKTPPLDQQYVRLAFAKAINRQEIVDTFITPLAPDVAAPLGNVIYVENQAEYEDHWSDVISHDPEGAIALLEENGCTRDTDGVFICEGERLEFDWVTTADNETRELTFEVIQQQLEAVGIKVNADFGDAATVFGDRLITGKYDIFEFAWVGSPDPAGGNTIWTCDGDLNYRDYCNEEVTDLINATDEAVDPAERAQLYNQADALMAQDVTVVPLYQKPTFFAWYTDIVGPKDNATQWGPLWNAGEWARAAAL
ncbi:MAG: ABC transporter family substrate-binding protein [Actinomycetota bacterium]